MKKQHRLFFYGLRGNLQTAFDSDTTLLISEAALPPPTEDNRVTGIHAFYRPRLPERLKVGSVFDLLFGKTIILKTCKVLPLRKNPMPEPMRSEAKECHFLVRGFRCKGERFWVYD